MSDSACVDMFHHLLWGEHLHLTVVVDLSVFSQVAVLAGFSRETEPLEYIGIHIKGNLLQKLTHH